MTNLSEKSFDALRAALAGVTTEPAITAPASTLHDATPSRIKDGFTDASCKLLLRPASTAEVAAQLKILGAAGQTVTVRGAASNVVGTFAVRPDVVISTERLTQIGDVDTVSQLVTVGAGVNGGELENTLQAQGYTLGQYPQSLYISTVGG